MGTPHHSLSSAEGSWLAPNPLLATIVAGVVTVGWLIALLVGAYAHDYTALTITTPVMLIAAGYAFGISVISRQRNGNGGNR